MIKEISKIEASLKMFGTTSVKIPKVNWSDVGGLANAKDDIL